MSLFAILEMLKATTQPARTIHPMSRGAQESPGRTDPAAEEAKRAGHRR
ncbi:MAG TPA: hypothetical protein VGL70_11210 [Candidatus Binatia bacterium]